MCIVRWRRNDDYVNVKNRISIIKKRVADGNPVPTGDIPILIKRTLFDCKGQCLSFRYANVLLQK